MANPSRTPGLYGYVAPDPSRYVPMLEAYLKPGGLTPVPVNTDVDRASLVTDWPMYCNGPDPENATVCPGSPSGCGCCVWAELGHMIQGMTAYAGTEIILPASSIITGYASTGYDPQTGANDNGTDPVQALEYMRTTGLTDALGSTHKFAGYARFGNPADEELIGQVLETFGTVFMAFDMQQAQEDQFSEGMPFTWVKGSPVVGGHGICLQRRATGMDILRYPCWGELQAGNKAFQFNQCTDAYAVVSEDFIRANGTTVGGMDLEQLLADLDAVS